jgi:hypothetical protein
MREVLRQKFHHSVGSVVRMAGSALLLASLVSCSSQAVTSTEGELISVSGYSIHYRVELANTSIDPVGYTITLKNTGVKALIFKPSPPNCTLSIDPNSYTASPFDQVSNSGFQASQAAVLTLGAGETCTLQLPIKDLESPLRGGTHDCQLIVKPELSEAERSAADPTQLSPTLQPLRSKIFKISVP